MWIITWVWCVWALPFSPAPHLLCLVQETGLARPSRRWGPRASSLTSALETEAARYCSCLALPSKALLGHDWDSPGSIPAQGSKVAREMSHPSPSWTPALSPIGLHSRSGSTCKLLHRTRVSRRPLHKVRHPSLGWSLLPYRVTGNAGH